MYYYINIVCVYKTDRKTKHVNTYVYHIIKPISTKHTELYKIAIEKDFGRNNLYVFSFWLQAQRVHWHAAILLQLAARDNVIVLVVCGLWFMDTLIQ